MPTQRKVDLVEELRQLIERFTIAVTADHSGMNVVAMTDLRRALRERGVEFHVVKNRLTYLAADAAKKPYFKEVVQGPTGIAWGFDESLEPAKALADYIRMSRAPIRITGGVLGERTLSVEEVGELAALPSKNELIARLAGQIQGPIAALAYVLSAPLTGLATVLQRHAESMASKGEAPAEEEAATEDETPAEEKSAT